MSGRGSGWGDRSEYAASTYTFRYAPLEEALRAVASAGFQRTEVWAHRTHADPRTGISPREIREALSRAGITAHSFHGPFAGIEEPPFSPEYFHVWGLLIDAVLESCEECGAGYCVLHPLDRKWLNPRIGDLPRLRDWICERAARAARRGVRLLLENLEAGNEAGELPCGLGDILRQFGDLPVGICLDVGHGLVAGESLRDRVPEAADRIESVHLHSNDGKTDDHLPPDQGILDWPGLRSLLRESGYTGRFVLETAGGGDPPRILERLRSLPWDGPMDEGVLR